MKRLHQKPNLIDKRHQNVEAAKALVHNLKVSLSDVERAFCRAVISYKGKLDSPQQAFFNELVACNGGGKTDA